MTGVLDLVKLFVQINLPSEMNTINIIRKEIKRPWWYRSLRAVNGFIYRYWWVVWLMFFAYLLLWYLYCFKTPYLTSCLDKDLISEKINKVNADLDNCCGCSVKTTYQPVPDCSDRVMVFQVCNSNNAKDDDFEVLLNGIIIGKLNLNSNDKVGSVFIASNDHNIKIVEPDFTCPLSNMNVYFFDPTIVKFGNNKITMNNIFKNKNQNMGTIEIRNYLLNGYDLISPCTVNNFQFKGGDGVDFDFNFNYTKCCE